MLFNIFSYMNNELLCARSYYETIARGYADAGFDIGVLNEAVQESVRRMRDEMDPEEDLNETWQMTL